MVLLGHPADRADRPGASGKSVVERWPGSSREQHAHASSPQVW